MPVCWDMDAINSFLVRCNTYLWGLPTLLLLVGVGMFFTVRLGFFQFRRAGLWIRGTFGAMLRGGGQGADGVTPFQSVTAALAATIGIGNIVGVSGAVALGGPGAVLWMWISALFGMMTKYAEVLLTVRFRSQGVSGAMAYLKNGAKSPLLAGIYAFLALLSSMGIGNLVQCNSAALAVRSVMPVLPAWQLALIITAGVAAATAAGIAGIAKVTEKLVPFMAAAYTLMALGVLVARADALPGAISSIVTDAFSFRAAAGGTGGYVIMAAMRYGVGRGVFSNEAGLGTSAFAHSASREREPVRQALWGVFEVFVDTLLMCTLTAMVLLVGCTGEELAGGGGVALPLLAFSRVYGTAGRWFLALFVFLFGYSTVIAWYHYGRCAYRYLFPHKKSAPYRAVFLTVTAGGCLFRAEIVWNAADLVNGLLLLPNIAGLLMLSGTVREETRAFLSRYAAGGRRLGMPQAPPGIPPGSAPCRRRCSGKGTRADSDSCTPRSRRR